VRGSAVFRSKGEKKEERKSQSMLKEGLNQKRSQRQERTAGAQKGLDASIGRRRGAHAFLSAAR